MSERIEGAEGLQEENGEQITEAEVETTGLEVTETEEPKDESVKDTVKRALEEEKKKLPPDGLEGEGEKEPEKALNKPEKLKKEEPEKIDVPVPARLNAEEREVFSKLNKGMKRAVSRMFQEQERSYTSAMQQLRAAENNVRGMVDAISPYVDEWAERKFTAPQAIAALAAANRKLCDPKTSKAEYIKLGRELGHDFEEIAKLARGESDGGEVSTAVLNHPEFLALKKSHDELKSYIEQSKEQQLGSTVQSIVSELETVVNEKDPVTGALKYPELSDEAFLQSVKPLVSALKATIPGLSYADALRRAYANAKGEPTGNSSQVIQSRLPAQQVNTQQRALNAAVSVRGRATPTGNGITLPDKIPDSVRETTRMALDLLRRG